MKLAKELEVDIVRATHLIPHQGIKASCESLVNYAEEANKIFDEARQVVKELKLVVFMPGNFNLNDMNKTQELIFNKKCEKPFYFIHIHPTGKVTACESFPIDESCLGDLSKQHFNEIWEGKGYKKLRRLFKLSRYPDYCRNCPVWGDESLEGYKFVERDLPALYV